MHYISTFSLPSETFIYDLINNLDDEGIENYVLTHNRQLERDRPFSKIKILSEENSKLKKIYNILFNYWNIKNQKNVLEHILEISPKVIHAHFGPNGIKMYNLLKKNNLDIPLIISFHGMDINVLPKKYKKYMERLLEINGDEKVLFTSPSQFLKDKMVSIGLNSDKIYIIPNAYNKNFENVIKKNMWKKGDELKLINIGRFEEVKGQKYLLKAFKLVLNEYPNSKLTIVGYGKLERKLKRLCKNLDLEEKVSIYKKINHSEIPKLLIDHDIYIQPSIVTNDGAEENLSVSTIEAQVCGLPAIVSNIGGLKEIVLDDMTGKFVEQKNAYDLASKISYYINNPNILKIHSEEAYINSRRVYNKKNILPKVRGIYEKIQKR